MPDPIEKARKRALPRLRKAILRGSPRLEVSAMLALTSLSGFLCSFALLHLGLERMGFRYPISVLVAYGVFLAQLRLWVIREARRSHRERRGSVVGDLVGEVADAVSGGGGGRGGGGGGLGWSSGGGGGAAPRWTGGGGRFAGGGASGGFDLPVRAAVADVGSPGGDVAGEVGSAAVDAIGGAFDSDDGWPIVAAIVVVALAVSSIAAAGYVIYTAPQLLAEVFFDGAVAGVLYRRARRGAAREWWQGALSRTWIPALVVFVFFTAGGFVLEWAAPGARTLGDVLRWLGR